MFSHTPPGISPQDIQLQRMFEQIVFAVTDVEHRLAAVKVALAQANIPRNSAFHGLGATQNGFGISAPFQATGHGVNTMQPIPGYAHIPAYPGMPSGNAGTYGMSGISMPYMGMGVSAPFAAQTNPFRF